MRYIMATQRPVLTAQGGNIALPIQAMLSARIVQRVNIPKMLRRSARIAQRVNIPTMLRQRARIAQGENTKAVLGGPVAMIARRGSTRQQSQLRVAIVGVTI